MSQGFFIDTRYEADNGSIYPIRVQPETITLVVGGTINAPPAGAIDQFSSARVSGGRRRIGVKARQIRFVFVGAAPDGYEDGSILTLPILTRALYNAIPTTGATGTYLGSTIRVVGKSSQAGR